MTSTKCKCTRCKHYFDVSNFYQKKKLGNDGSARYYSECRKCHAARVRSKTKVKPKILIDPKWLTRGTISTSTSQSSTEVNA